MNNLTKRIITGLILAASIILLVFLGSFSYIFSALAINVLGLLEFYRLFDTVLAKPLKWLGLAESLIIFLSVSLIIFHLLDWQILLINIPIPFIIFLTELYRRNKNPFQNIAFTFLGIIYITIPSVFLIAMASTPIQPGLYNPKLVLGYFFIVWASDTGSYFAGRSIGKHKLSLRISPKKPGKVVLKGL